MKYATAKNVREVGRGEKNERDAQQTEATEFSRFPSVDESNVDRSLMPTFRPVHPMAILIILINPPAL